MPRLPASCYMRRPSLSRIASTVGFPSPCGCMQGQCPARLQETAHPSEHSASLLHLRSYHSAKMVFAKFNLNGSRKHRSLWCIADNLGVISSWFSHDGWLENCSPVLPGHSG